MRALRLFKRFQKAYRSGGRKPMVRIILEYLKLRITSPPTAEQYFKKYLFRQNVSNFSNYVITSNMLSKMWKLSNHTKNYYTILSDKYIAELFLSKNNLSVVKSIARNKNSLFFIGDNFSQINDLKDFIDFLHELKNKGLWYEEELFIKKVRDTHSGKDVYRISYTDLISNSPLISSLFDTVHAGDYIFQNKILQHPSLNKVNPFSVNTIRVDTFRNKTGHVQILSMFLRTSSNTIFVDNSFSGGLLVGINMDTGQLYSEAATDFEKGKGRIYLKHPQTGLEFENYQIPFFEEIKKTAIDAAYALTHLRFVAWDIAVKQDGPVIVEGNFFSGSGLYNSELSQSGFGTNKVFQEFVKEISTSQPQSSVIKNRVKVLNPFRGLLIIPGKNALQSNNSD